MLVGDPFVTGIRNPQSSSTFAVFPTPAADPAASESNPCHAALSFLTTSCFLRYASVLCFSTSAARCAMVMLAVFGAVREPERRLLNASPPAELEDVGFGGTDF
jgi:hypothetical protein